MKKSKLIIISILVSIIFLVLIFVGINIIKNYNTEIAYVEGKINLIINNNNVTKKLKYDLFTDENNVIYMSKNDIQNYFDKYIIIEESSNKIITTDKDQIGVLPLNENFIILNDVTKNITSGAIKTKGTYYLPISELSDMYNVDINYIEDEKILILDSLDRQLLKANVLNNCNISAKKSIFSKSIAQAREGETVVIIEKLDNNWTKVRSKNGYIGYVKSNNLEKEFVARNATITEENNKKINLVWDYFSEYAKAPNRTGTVIEGVNVVSPSFFTLVSKGAGKINNNVGNEGIKYINWAKQNNYKIWPMFSNNSYKETTSEILSTYTNRTVVINNIMNLAKYYELDGINLDFENVSKADKDLLSRFIIELKPRLKKEGMTLSVDVTAPDGGDDWSECYDRNVIGDVADYIVFMAYDQYGINSKSAGTTAGYNWVENSLKKFIDREEVKSNKIILAIPLYTRLWGEKDGEIVVNKTVDMNAIDKTIPEDAQRVWNEELKQNYVEYIDKNTTYKMWIEDENSIKEKLSLIRQYELAGAGFWEKDRETEGIWSMVDKELNQ